MGQDADVDHFTRWDHYLDDFNPMYPELGIDTAIKAIQLEAGLLFGPIFGDCGCCGCWYCQMTCKYRHKYK